MLQPLLAASQLLILHWRRDNFVRSYVLTSDSSEQYRSLRQDAQHEPIVEPLNWGEHADGPNLLEMS